MVQLSHVFTIDMHEVHVPLASSAQTCGALQTCMKKALHFRVGVPEVQPFDF